MRGVWLPWSIVLGAFVAFARNAVLRWLSSASPKRQIQGILTIDLISEGDTEVRFARLADALKLIGSVDPHRLETIRNELSRIVLYESGPEYWPGSRACVLHDISSLTPIDVALHIVHETAHARLWRKGVRYAPDQRARVERACVASEIRFLNRLPNSDSLKYETQKKLENEWWTASHMRSRHISLLKTLSAPNWIIKLFTRVR